MTESTPEPDYLPTDLNAEPGDESDNDYPDPNSFPVGTNEDAE